MDLENLETFIKVAETKSFSRSAEELGVTQPAISKRIAALEARLSAKLFDRIGRVVQLTEAGHTVLPRAKQIQAELSSIREALATGDGNQVHGPLSIATTSCVATNQLSPILEYYQKAFPEVTLSLSLSTTDEALELMEANSLELAICPIYPESQAKLPATLQCIELWHRELKIAVANNHPLADADSATTEDLIINKAILPPAGLLLTQAITSAISPGPNELSVPVRANDYGTMSSLAAIGMGWACLPASRVDDSLTALNIPGLELRYSVCLIRRRGRTLSRAAEAFVRTISESTTLDHNKDPEPGLIQMA